jgi:hypothetical protein
MVGSGQQPGSNRVRLTSRLTVTHVLCLPTRPARHLTSWARQDEPVKAPPASTKTSLTRRLNHHARTRWPDLTSVEVRFRASFAYVNGRLTDGTLLKLCRLRYGGSAHTWGFALYRASHDDYQDTFLPNGMLAGSAEEALDCACGLYLNDPSAWLPDPPTN